MTDVDHIFQEARKQARARRRRARLKRVLTGLAVLAVGLGAGAWFTRDMWHLREPGAVTVVAGGQQLEAVGEAGHETLSAFVNLPGDPMTLHLDSAAPQDRGARTIDRPGALPPERGAGALTLVQDVMISGQERVVTTLPSTQEDFAVFQAQRRGLQGAAVGGAPPGAAPAPAAAARRTPAVCRPSSPAFAAAAASSSGAARENWSSTAAPARRPRTGRAW